MAKTKIRDLTRKFNLRTPVAKRIKSNGATKLKLRKKQGLFTNLDSSKILQYQNLVQVVQIERGLRDKDLGT